jgi:hypothetical protein
MPTQGPKIPPPVENRTTFSKFRYTKFPDTVTKAIIGIEILRKFLFIFLDSLFILPPIIVTI